MTSSESVRLQKLTEIHLYERTFSTFRAALPANSQNLNRVLPNLCAYAHTCRTTSTDNISQNLKPDLAAARGQAQQADSETRGRGVPGAGAGGPAAAEGQLQVGSQLESLPGPMSEP
eukprot:993425-Rhodomonas_salina.1